MQQFLIQLTDKPTYFTDARDGKVFETIHLTLGRQMSYESATSIASRLKHMGYEFAFVVDAYGQPPTATDLAAVKRDRQYRVMFSKRFFLQNPKGQDCGTTNINQAAVMTQDAAKEIARRLRGRGHLDAAAIEVDAPIENTDDELAKIWPEEFASEKHQ